ncbi:hypothetical protein NPIL_14991 [Nephila pilipes]|uniref:Uncharacterized protein n=1 Tax=Nephila pilipes TaxID=299642 RepID=A0A8X6UJP9_NEPPI|nr:hypothetical protein NPIL_14991 [Nephila pilipes]
MFTDRFLSEFQDLNPSKQNHFVMTKQTLDDYNFELLSEVKGGSQVDITLYEFLLHVIDAVILEIKHQYLLKTGYPRCDCYCILKTSSSSGKIFLL